MNRELTQLLLDTANRLENDVVGGSDSKRLLDRVQAALNGELDSNGCMVCANWEQEYHEVNERTVTMNTLTETWKGKEEDYNRIIADLKAKFRDSRQRHSEAIITINQIYDAARNGIMFGRRKKTLAEICDKILNDSYKYS